MLEEKVFLLSFTRIYWVSSTVKRSICMATFTGYQGSNTVNWPMNAEYPGCQEEDRGNVRYRPCFISSPSGKGWDDPVSLHHYDRLCKYTYAQSAHCAALKRPYVIDNSWWIGHVEVKGIITGNCDLSLLSQPTFLQENKAWDLDFCGGNLFWKANPGTRESETRKEERQIKCALLSWLPVWAIGAWPCWYLLSGWTERFTQRIVARSTYQSPPGSPLDLLWLTPELTPFHSKALSVKYHSTRSPGRWEKWCLQHKRVKACSDLPIVATATTGNRTKESLMGSKSRTGFQQGSVQKRFGPLCQDGYFHKEVSVKGPCFISSYFGKPSHFARHFITRN